MSHLPGTPPELDPRHKSRIGLAVLEDGLPPLPALLDYSMSVPVAFWTARVNAVVLFLQFSRLPDGTFHPMAKMMRYARNGNTWNADPWVTGVGWSHDPIAHPQDTRDLGGRAMVHCGGSYSDHPVPGRLAAIAMGRVGQAVAQIALIHDGTEDRRPLQSHFGAWVVCVEHWSPYEINALDSNGAVLATVSGPPRLPSPPGPARPSHPEAGNHP
jgi:hypothetical protein